jgi:hypothetical protein
MSTFNDDVTLPGSVSEALAAVPKQQLDAAIAQVSNAIPSKVSDLTNDSGFIADLSGFDSDDLTEGASHLFLTAAEQAKLAGIADGAEVNVQADWDATSGDAAIKNKPSIPDPYTLPIASDSILGGVKVGTNLSIDANGVLSASGGISSVSWGDIGGTLSNQTDLANALAGKADTSALFSGDYSDLSGKPTIPTNNNQLTNGEGYITASTLDGYMPTSGGTFSGDVSLGGYALHIGDSSNIGYPFEYQIERADGNLVFTNTLNALGMSLDSDGGLALDGDLSIDGELLGDTSITGALVVSGAARITASGSVAYLEGGTSSSDTSAGLVIARYSTVSTPLKAVDVHANSINLLGETIFGTVNWIGDANDITQSGFYRTNYDDTFKLMIHIQHPTTPDYALQIGTSAYDGAFIYARAKTAGTWGAASALN